MAHPLRVRMGRPSRRLGERINGPPSGTLRWKRPVASTATTVDDAPLAKPKGRQALSVPRRAAGSDSEGEFAAESLQAAEGILVDFGRRKRVQGRGAAVGSRAVGKGGGASDGRGTMIAAMTIALRNLPWVAGKSAGAPTGVGRWVAQHLAAHGRDTYVEPYANVGCPVATPTSEGGKSSLTQIGDCSRGGVLCETAQKNSRNACV